jgi:hypothetical protein|tara:strand:+ start:628 stop:861 length:234 start_codon:yes stop_codon:yes gene_type:complete
MENIEVSEIIANLKGRREYEEKKAKKLGYDCLYKYFEDKLDQAAKLKAEDENLAKIEAQKILLKKEKLKEKNTCSCC